MSFQKISITPPDMTTEISEGGGGGGGAKRSKFLKDRGCLCETISPDGHARLAIIAHVLDIKCAHAYYVVLANKK